MPNAWRMHSRLLSRLACETITPFGSLVEPDVYCRNARSVSRTRRRLQMFGQRVDQLVGGDPLAGGRVGGEQLGIERRERRGGGEGDVRVAIDARCD